MHFIVEILSGLPQRWKDWKKDQKIWNQNAECFNFKSFRRISEIIVSINIYQLI